MKPNSIGEQELELLRFINDHEPISVGDVASQYGKENGLARSTVLTMMERLRKKGFLSRAEGDSAFVYRLSQSKHTVLKDLAAEFVERTLGGSVTPLLAYLAEAKNLKPEEVEQLRKLIDGDGEEESK
jgi:predicted transcriptional regulator